MANETQVVSGGTLGPSLVRTAVPFIAGLIGTWLLDRFGAQVDSATIGAFLTAGIGYVYYVVVRFLEVYGSDKWGYILGFHKQPTYAAVDPMDVKGRHERGADGELDLYTAGMVVTVVSVVGLVVALLIDSPGWLTVAVAGICAGVALVAVCPRFRRH